MAAKKNGAVKDTLSEIDRLTAQVATEKQARWTAEVAGLEQVLSQARQKLQHANEQAQQVRDRLQKKYKTADDDAYNLETGAIVRKNAPAKEAS